MKDITYKINRLFDKILSQLHLFGMEIYKSGWIQKGVLVLALFLYFAFTISFTAPVAVKNAAEAAANDYTIELAGKITDDTFVKLDELQAQLDKTLQDYEEAKVAYENGNMEYQQFDIYMREAYTAQIKSEGLDKVRNRIEKLYAQSKDSGFTPYLIDETPYKSVYGNAARDNRQQAAIISIIALVLLLAGSITYENASGMNCVLAATAKGRSAILIRKILLALLATFIVWGVMYGLELKAFFSICANNTTAASVQNLSFLGANSFKCSIGAFLALMYIFRFVTLFCTTLVTLLISSCIKRMSSSYIAVSVVLVLPSLLYAYMGVEPLKYISLITPLEFMPLVLSSYATIAIWGVFVLLLLLVGVAIFGLGKQLKVWNMPKMFGGNRK